MDYLETVLSRRHVYTSDVDDVGELSVMVVLQKMKHGQNATRGDENFQLFLGRHVRPLYVLGQTFGDVHTEFRQLLSGQGIVLPYGSWKFKSQRIGFCILKH